MTKWSQWGVWPFCAAMSGALGCYDTGGRGDVDASRSDAPTGPPTLPEQCNLAWLRTIPVDATELGLVMSIAVDRDENVLVSFYASAFTLDGVRYRGGDFLIGLDRENRLRFPPIARTVRLTSTEGRILGVVGAGRMTSVVEIDGRTGETLRDFGAFRAEELSRPEAAFVGETLVLSMTVGGEFAFPGETMRVLPRGTGVVLAIRPDRWVGIGELAGRLTSTSAGVLMLGGPGPLCFNGVCQEVLPALRLIGEDGAVVAARRSALDGDYSDYASRIEAQPDGSLVTLGVFVGLWGADGNARWTQEPPWSFNLSALGVSSDVARVVTMTSIESMPTATLGSFLLDLGANSQELFIDYSLTDGTPRRWWHIENPDGAVGRSGASWFVMGASGRSYATGIADPIVDVCGMRVTDGLFIAAFD